MTGQVIAAGLGQRRNGVGSDPLPTRYANVHTLVERITAKVGAPFPGSDRDIHRMVGVGRYAHFAIATQCDRPNIGAIDQLVDDYHLFAGIDEQFAVIRNRQAIDLGGVEQAPHVIRQAKDFRPLGSLVDTNAFEHG